MTTQKIDICMTSTIRPKILEITLKSFLTNMLKDQSKFRLIINIDPIGENLSQKVILKVAKKYFDDIIHNYPKEPSFTKAVHWCWSKATSKYIFHLEEDWRLLIPINIYSMITILESYPKLSTLRLNKGNSGRNKFGVKHGFIYYPKLSLNPSLIKTEFIKPILPLMNLKRNPEKQLRIVNSPPGISEYLSLWTHGIYVKDSIGKVVQDIGRDWMRNSSYTKKTGFLKWEKK
jgi:hypothetical protein